MSIEEFFKKREQNTASSGKTDWGGIGSIPKVGNTPAQPALPAVNVPATQTKISEPSAASVEAANQVIASYSPLMKEQNNG